MRLTGKQKQMLIQIGLETLIAQGMQTWNGTLKMPMVPGVEKSHPGVRHWSKKHRRKFYATLNRKKRESESKKPPNIE